MYTELNTYLDARISEVNATITGTDNDFLKINISLDTDELSENQKDKRYMLKIESYEDTGNALSKVYDGEAVIELCFLIPNGDTTKYQPIVDNYIHVLMNKIRVTPKYINGGQTFKSEIIKVGCKNLNTFTEDGEFKPEITLTFKVNEA